MNRDLTTPDESTISTSFLLLESSTTPKPPPLPSKLLKTTETYCFNKNVNNNICDLNELDLIRPNLYLGSLKAANDLTTLKKLNITHVLTIEENPLEDHLLEKLGVDKYKFKKLADSPYCNILQILNECIDFIDDAVMQSKNILVHW